MKLRFLEIQEKSGLSNIALAEKIGVDKQQVSNYRSGHRTPPLSTLQKIADAFNCDILELFEPSSSYEHYYDTSGEWLGIRKKQNL